MAFFNIDTLQITPNLLTMISEVDQFKGAWKVYLTQVSDRLLDWRRLATLESIGSSTRIEGSQMTDEEVGEFIMNLKIRDFATRDEQEVSGYASVMETILESWENIPITENYIKQLHRDLLINSDKDQRHRGEYKTHPNHVAAFDQDGREVEIIFKTITPFETPRRMEELVKWYQESHSQARFHPLISIAVFKLVFLAIHPFQDGNGRLSRLLVNLMLMQAGYDHTTYSSFESVIEGTKADYYFALRRSQVTLEADEPNWQPWLDYFFQTLLKQKRILEEKIDFEMRIREFGFSRLANTILFYANKNTYVTNRGIVAVSGASRNTIKATIQTLVKEGLLLRSGAGRSAKYRIALEKLKPRDTISV